MPRPYQQSTTAELEALFAVNQTDRSTLNAILDELRLRKKQKAVDLRRVVEAALAARAAPPPKAARPPVRTRQAPARTAPPARAITGTAATGTGAAPPAPRASTGPPPDTDLAGRYEALRATFTADAEILARWGATPLLPRDLRRQLFEAWAKLLRADPNAHPHRLTPDDLVRDIHALRGPQGAGAAPKETA